MKILFPHKDATDEEKEEILKFAIEGRKRIKDQIFRLDSTFIEARFGYKNIKKETESLTKTLEEEQYPQYYSLQKAEELDLDEGEALDPPVQPGPKTEQKKEPLKEGNFVFKENQKGVSFDRLFGPYLHGASLITITDPYIRIFFQIRNLMEFMETVVKTKPLEDEVEVKLITVKDDYKYDQQRAYFEQIRDNCATAGIQFSWQFDETGTMHARHIITETGWKISLDRGLDIFQHYEMNDSFSLSNRLQEHRACKAFEVTYLRHN